MLTVWKYVLPVTDLFSLQMPKGGELLTVQLQGDEAQLWALVEPEREREDRHFRLAGTGRLITENVFQYVGTFQTRMGLVFHLFEIVPD